MLTNPNEMVPLQIARGARADSARPLPDLSLTLCFPPPLGEGRVGALVAVFGAIPNIKGNAVSGLAACPVGGLPPCRLERAAQGVGEPTFAGNEGADLGNAGLAAAGRCGLASDRPPGPPARWLAARAGLGVPGADLLHRPLHGIPTRRALGGLSDRPGHP